MYIHYKAKRLMPKEKTLSPPKKTKGSTTKRLMTLALKLQR